MADLGELTKPVAEAAREIAKPVYDDLAHPAASAVGKALGMVANVLNMLLAPLERWQLASAAKTEEFQRSLAKKYEQIPEDKRKEPDLKIVYQIADKLKYSLDDDELREMFENLLIASMTKGKTVHPLFVDVVDKMTPEDARLFSKIGGCIQVLLINAYAHDPQKRSRKCSFVAVLRDDYVEWDMFPLDSFMDAVKLELLGLLKIKEMDKGSGKNFFPYNVIEELKTSCLEKTTNRMFPVARKAYTYLLEPTPLGRELARALGLFS